MDAAGQQALYIDELRRSLVPPIHPMVNGRQTETLIRRAECEAAAACSAADVLTWVWSDLHLGHEHSRSAFGRPFRTAAEADRAMMEAWYDQVAEGETIICLGDVTVDGEALAHHQEWWGKAPGAKWLVLGNHDRDVAGLLSSRLPQDLPDRVVRHRSAAGADARTAAEDTGRGRQRPRPSASGRRAERPARRHVGRAHRLRPREADVRARACPQAPGTQRGLATAGSAVGIGSRGS